MAQDSDSEKQRKWGHGQSSRSLAKVSNQDHFLLVIYWGEGQRERGKERERESQAGSRLSAEPNMGLDPTKYEIMT